jgi:hypothetical protein
MVNLVSYIPVVFVLALSTSASTGIYSGSEILVDSSKKLQDVTPCYILDQDKHTMAPSP